MKKYKLSKYSQLTGFDDYDATDIPAKYTTGYFILSNPARDSEYIIPETVRYFIHKFSTPKSCADVVSEVATDLKKPAEDIESACLSFVDYLCKKGILLPENEIELGVTDESFYKRGDAIEQYTITGVLDAKSGIDIYLAKDNSNDSLCVIKLLNCSRTSNANDREKGSAMLEREYLLLQKAASAPSIAKAFVFANDQHGNPYLVQEFIKGKPICEFIEETKTWTENDSLLLLKNLVNAFAQLHQCGIVHGDVHSSNVLVARDKTVRVIDLGMSLQQAEIDKAQTTRHGGVYEYMPPERIGRSSTNKFTKAPDFRSDVYQIGLLLYFLLYHNLPFKGFVWEDLSAAIQEGAASFPNTAAAGFSIPVGLRRLVQKCMATDPQNRYADATEIVTACNQYLLTENHAPLYA